MTQPGDSSDRLPGEFDGGDDDAMLKYVGLKLIRQGMEGADDAFLAQSLAIYHEEWERRHGEKWVIAE